MKAPVAAPLALVLAGCAVGKGEGVVVGSLVVPGCDGDEYLDERDRDEFDLDVDYFVGEPLFDTDEDETTTRDSLSIRVQHGGAPIETSDTLSIQVVDLGSVPEGAVEDVMPMGCQRSSGSDAPDDLRGCVRATLTLALTCPDAFESLEAAADDPTPEEPDSGDEIACPDELGGDDPFAGDFDKVGDFQDPFWTAGRHPSCIAFQQIGNDFGDEIAAVFHFNIRDARRVNGKSGAGGYLRGRFRFKLERGPGAQPFP